MTPNQKSDDDFIYLVDEEDNSLQQPVLKKARLVDNTENIIIVDVPVKPNNLSATEKAIVIENLTVQDVFDILLNKCKLVIYSYQNLKIINSSERNIISNTLIQHILNKNPSQK